MKKVLLSGILDEITVFELLQFVEQRKKETSQIIIYLELKELRAEIYLKEKKIVHAQVSHIKGLKAFYRILKWKSGAFEVVAEPFQVTQTLNENVDDLLLSGLANNDEFQLIAKNLLRKGQFCNINRDVSYLKAYQDGYLNSKSIELLKIINMNSSLKDILEESEDTDLETVKSIYQLLGQGFIFLASVHFDK